MRVLMLGTVLLKIADWSFGGSVTSPCRGRAPVTVPSSGSSLFRVGNGMTGVYPTLEVLSLYEY
jgi:hypothetical protein